MKVEVSAIGNFLCIGMALQWGLVSVGCAAAGSLVLSRILSPPKIETRMEHPRAMATFQFRGFGWEGMPPGLNPQASAQSISTDA